MAYWQGLSFREHPPQNCSKSLLVPVNLEFWKLWTFLYILLLDISWTILHWTPANDPKIGQKENLDKTCASQPQVSGFLHFTSHRFSAFWLRSKCSICSYQLNIWYENHVFSSILNWFLEGDRVQELAPAPSSVGLALQYRLDWHTENPTKPMDSWTWSRVHLLCESPWKTVKQCPFLKLFLPWLSVVCW